MNEVKKAVDNSRSTTLGIFLAFLLVGAAAGLGIRCATRGEGPEPAKTKAERAAPPKVEPEPPEAPEGLLLDLGNELCPIMGKPANGHTYSEWNGLRVGHCCVPCIEDFLAEPETALDAAGIEWKKAAEAVARFESAAPEHRRHVLMSIEKEFEVVRVPEGLR